VSFVSMVTPRPITPNVSRETIMTIRASTSHALCKHVAGCMYKVVRKGSKAAMDRARKRENAGFAHSPYRVFLAGAHRIGDYIH
jgi:hypothetical protein